MELAFLSETSKKSPSELIGETDELTAFCFDSAVMSRYVEWKNKRDLMRFDQLRFLIIQATHEAKGLREIAPPVSFDDDFDDHDDDIEADEEGIIRVGIGSKTKLRFGDTEAELMNNPDVL